MSRDVKRWLVLFAILTTTAIGALLIAPIYREVAGYAQIKPGMTGSEVIAILGEPTSGDVEHGECFMVWKRTGYSIEVVISPQDGVVSKEIDRHSPVGESD